MEPVNIVASYMRCGSTAVMHGCAAGGMSTIWTPGRAERFEQATAGPGYSLNHGNLYELELCPACFGSYPNPDCDTIGCLTMVYNHLDRYRGCVMKITMKLAHKTLHELPEFDGYKAVFLLRGYDEIAASHEAAFGALPRITEDEYVERMHIGFEDFPGEKQSVKVRDGLLHDDFGTRVTAWEQLGWPLDHVAAARAIEPDRIRYRTERMVPGILDRTVEVRHA